MRQFHRKILGVSIFELLLVLGVVSMLTVSAIKYVEQQRDEAAAKAYGVKLYTFGEAVTRYISDAKLTTANPVLPGAGIDENAGKNAAYQTATVPTLPGEPAPPEPTTLITAVTDAGVTTITATGIDWLKEANAGLDPQGEPYLKDDFNFTSGLGPLIVALPDPTTGEATLQGDAAFSSTIVVSNATLPTIALGVGAFYEPTTPPTLAPVLTQEAMTHANNLYDSAGDGKTVQYKFPYIESLQSEENQAAAPSGVGTGEEIGGIFGQVPTTPPAGTPTDPNIQPTGEISTQEPASIYLKTDGSNTMEGDLVFSAASASNQVNQLKNVGTLKFISSPDDKSIAFGSVVGKVNELLNFTSLTFSDNLGLISGIKTLASNTITGINTLNMTGAATITGLELLDFSGSASSIQKLKSINFPGWSFNGITVTAYALSGSATGSWTTGGNTLKMGCVKGVGTCTTGHDVCFLTRVLLKDNTLDTDSRDGCMIIRGGTDTVNGFPTTDWWLKVYGDGSTNNSCSAKCLTFTS